MKKNSYFVTSLLIAISILAMSATAMAATSGAIQTTFPDGTVVNGNLYPSKDVVYLTGGPQNKSASGLSPDGVYYFQVTNPSGSKLLSSDDISCREVQVTGGKIVAATGPCPHAEGTANAANGSLPVQLLPYDNTDNPGGEYKAWLIPVDKYNLDACPGNYGFCDADSKTDNFKIRNPEAAYITVCKFNDVNGDGIQGSADDEPLIPHWPIVATGVDAGQASMTDDFGCVSYAITNFSGDPSSATVTLSEGSVSGWTQTAPQDGNGNVLPTQTFTVHPGDVITAPNFGNTNGSGCSDPSGCGNQQGGPVLSVSKDANPSYDKKYTWTITKAVDKTEIDSSSTSAEFHYTVTVTHDSGTASNWKVSGTITVGNDGDQDAVGVNVTDSDSHCTVTDPTGVDHTNATIPAGLHVDFPYSCTYTSQPDPFTNTATATPADASVTPASGDAAVDFANASVNKIDDSINVTDTLGGNLGTVTSADPSPTDLKYSYTVNGTAGTCTTQDNTATFTTNTTQTTGQDSKTVKLCVGANLTVSKTATPSFTSNIVKTANQTSPVEANGPTTLSYRVVVTESGWKVAGNITVTNPNDWEAVSVNLSDALSVTGGVCSISGGSPQSVPASGSISPAYTCTFAAAPAASGTNTAGITWDGTAAYTTGSSASSDAIRYTFSSLTVTDAFNGTLTPKTLGTISVPTASTTYTDSYNVNPGAGKCLVYPNIATITQTGQTSSASVTACNIKTGALTMGFWQGPNGQKAIGTSKTGTCPAYTLLTGFNPFADLISSTKQSCADVNAYISKVVNGANSSGSGGLMLKGQMMATILTAAYGTNPIVAAQGTVSNLGAVNIQLNPIKGTEDDRPAFFSYTGTNGKEAVSAMISDANALWAASGCVASTGSCTAAPTGAYDSKAVLVLASNAFAYINQGQANIAP